LASGGWVDRHLAASACVQAKSPTHPLTHSPTQLTNDLPTHPAPPCRWALALALALALRIGAERTATEHAADSDGSRYAYAIKAPSITSPKLKPSSAPGFVAPLACAVNGHGLADLDDATLAYSMALTRHPLDGSSRPLAVETVVLPIPALAPSLTAGPHSKLVDISPPWMSS
jgi:hypothetical protein